MPSPCSLAKAYYTAQGQVNKKTKPRTELLGLLGWDG